MISEICRVSFSKKKKKYCIELAGVYKAILTRFQSLRLRWCIIVGCERECREARAEPERSLSGEAERVAEGSREAVHSGIKKERWTHGRVRSLNLSGKLFSYSGLLVYLWTLVASPFCALLLEQILVQKPLMCVRIKLVLRSF